MTTATQPASQAPVAKSGALASLLNLIGLAKSVDEAALRDLEMITGNIEGVPESHAMPTAAEVVTGPAQAMRGGQAVTQVNAHSDLAPQEGMTKMYDEFNARISAMQKSIGTVAVTVKNLVDGIQAAAKAQETQAEEDKKREEGAKGAEKSAANKDNVINAAVRKARVAVRKAEDEDDKEDDDWKESMEKANAALAVLDESISKAEEEMETDEDEKRTEKARADLKALKAKLKAKVKAREEAAAKAANPEPTPVQTITRKTNPASSIQAELEAFATTKGITVNDLMSALNGQPSNINTPPAFAKALESTTALDIDKRIEDAADNGLLDNTMLMKAQSIKSRLGLARAGKFDMDAVMREIVTADAKVRDIFAPMMAA